jgi:hypothetical protein
MTGKAGRRVNHIGASYDGIVRQLRSIKIQRRRLRYRVALMRSQNARIGHRKYLRLRPAIIFLYDREIGIIFSS